jgi:hypothetical protein
MSRLLRVLIVSVAIAAFATGCHCCAEGEAAGIAPPAHLVFNPAETWEIDPVNVRATWPAASAQLEAGSDVVYRETVADYQGRSFFQGNDYVRHFRSIRDGAGRR